MENTNINLKESVINEILLRMQCNIERQQLQILETVLITVLYHVEIVKMETQLSTHMDDNDYLLDTYKMQVTKDGLSPRTIAQYMSAMHRLLCMVDKNIRQIDSMDIKYYLDAYADRGNDPRTVNNERRFISAVFSWFRRNKYIVFNPVESVPLRKERKKKIDYLKGIETEVLRESCKTVRERALLEFLLSTGVRVGEVPLIKRNDVDWQNWEIMVYGQKTKEYRTVYLNDTAALHLKIYLDSRTDNDEGLFVSCRRSYHTIKEDALRGIIKKIGSRSGMNRRIYPHLMRKTMATTLRIKDCPIEDVQKMLGHENPSTTLTYYAAVDDDRMRYMHKKYLAQGA